MYFEMQKVAIDNLIFVNIRSSVVELNLPTRISLMKSLLGKQLRGNGTGNAFQSPEYLITLFLPPTNAGR